GGNLKARHVIHTVGPVYRDGKHGEADLLASAYRASLALAEDKGLASVSFPSISTGAYRYPLDAAAAIAIRTVGGFLRQASGLRRVRFVLFGDAAYEAYARALKKGQAPGRNP
ncbi:MAG TPA: macro domain-containing protein, partial [Nitrospiria bacterium]|nr:macro domain-containing protein [Nitrospiria bacterium]